MPQERPISTMVVDEYFATSDERFASAVRSVNQPKYLAGLADRWKKDPRPFAREQILNYLAQPLDRPGHNTLVKRLFKQAEADKNDGLMAAFLVAFDRLIRRRRRTRHQWDFQTRQSTQEEELFAPRDNLTARRLPSGQFAAGAMPSRRSPARLFSYKTRHYIRRRVWRYFRWMGFQQPLRYPAAVAGALMLYRDEDFAAGENILDSWCILNIAFRHGSVLKFSPTAVEIADGQSLGQLTAAPRFPKLWRQPESAPLLLKLVTQAQSRLVRVWATQLLKQDHATFLSDLCADDLLQLLDHADNEVQEFGAQLLATMKAVDSWPVTTWLRLLQTRSDTALATICAAMTQRVQPARLDLAQCVALTCARATPVAKLGFSFLSGRAITTPDARQQLVRLAGAQCQAIGEQVAAHALAIIGQPANYRTEWVSAFFDSLNPKVRAGAWQWLTPQSAGHGDAALWSRLLETPYDDVRHRLVEELGKRTRSTDGPLAAPQAPALKKQDFSQVWTTVLLGVHRGGRAKLQALRQISQTIALHPQQADGLLPVLVVAIQSVRPAEARAGLSAILSAVSARPELEALLARQLPELILSPAGNAAATGVTT